MDQNISNNSQRSILNLLAIGGFLWYFIISAAALCYHLSKTIGIISGANPYVFFWLNELIYLAVIFLIARLTIRRIWHDTLHGDLNSKRILYGLGVGIAIVYILTLLHNFFIIDYLFNNQLYAWRECSAAGFNIDPYGLIGILVNLIGSILLLASLVNRRKLD